MVSIVSQTTSDWALKRSARRWQTEALNRWRSANRGVVAVVTGAGKTIFAMQCMLTLRATRTSCRFLVVVPTVALLDQWHAAFIEELGVTEDEITLIGGGARSQSKGKIVLAVLDSARRIVPDLVEDGDWFLIVDECHRAASEKNRAILKGRYVATLGLSATPERQYDRWFDEFIVPVLGPVIFRYTYLEALKDGVIAEFELWNIRVPLSDEEEAALDKLGASIAREIQRLDRQGLIDSPRLRHLLLKRSRCSQAAVSRIHTAVELVEKWHGSRGIVFHEFTASADRIADILTRRGHRARAYHSGLGPPTRYKNLRLYVTGQIDVLVTCRALDEGLDVPTTQFGIIAASTSSIRQRIQRLGRILRPAPKKARALITTLYALPTEGENLRRESIRMAGITKTRWFDALPK